MFPSHANGHLISWHHIPDFQEFRLLNTWRVPADVAQLDLLNQYIFW